MVRRVDYGSQVKAYSNFVSKMNSEDEDFKRYQELATNWHKKNPGDMRPITQTGFWHFLIEKGNSPESYFYATPPIAEAATSNRILVSGTKAEVRDLDEILRGFEAYQRVVAKLDLRNPQKRILAQPSVTEKPSISEIISSELPSVNGIPIVYGFTSSVGWFWDRFFDNPLFLDKQEKNSIPLAILATGKMRNYNQCGGETMWVKERLEAIASAWNVPIKFIRSWAL